MIVRKHMGRASPILLLLLAFGFFFATYNLLTMIIHNKASNLGSRVVDGVKRSGELNSKFHVALTATDAPYSQWQCRIMYYWYKKVKDMPGSDMGKFTRILHSGIPDKLMKEIPTFVVDPLPEGLDRVRILLVPVFLLSFVKSICTLFL
jgi:hypothetical protein